MIKRTLCFSTPGNLRLHLCQLCWHGKDGREASVPIEDIGVILIESPLITVSTALLQSLTEQCVAVILCDAGHMPSSYLLPATAHTLAHHRIQSQVNLTDARKNRLWAEIIRAKIRNQAEAARSRDPELAEYLSGMEERVRKGDPDNLEAQAARAYFSLFASQREGFVRDRYGDAPNAALNYGYAVLRASVARALVSSGLLPIFGIHHSNQYNHFCLADDMMEPYRPFIDLIVLDNFPFFAEINDANTLTPEGKRILLSFLTEDVFIGRQKRPLMNALAMTAASLARVIAGEDSQLTLPELKHLHV